MLVCSGISLLWGVAVESGAPGGAMGFPGIYYGTRCLIQHCDPYNVIELDGFYRAEGGANQTDTIQRRQSVTLYVNLPTTFLFVAPFALLPFKLAHLLWMTLTVGGFTLAAYLMWSLGAVYAPSVSLFLVCIFLANAEVVFAGGNTAGIVVSLCVVAVWCFLNDRFVRAGILCLAVSLAIKPHDGGLVWLYFILAGGVFRKRALQSLAITFALGVTAILWLSRAIPNWIPEMRSNLATISVHGGINDPGPVSIGMRIPGMVIDLQTVLSVFYDNSHFYNLVSYLVCGTLLLVWLNRTFQSHFSSRSVWFALASITALTMLVTYHRPYDAKLLLLAVPACAMLWAEGGAIAWVALLLTTMGAVFTGDIPLAVLVILTKNMQAPASSLAAKLLFVALTRPVPLILLSICVFYLWAYLRTHQAYSRLERIPIEESA
jgi:hypothetical protein